MVQVALSLDTWTWNAEAYAASQRMPTLQICCGEPRSTSSHCGSLDSAGPAGAGVAVGGVGRRVVGGVLGRGGRGRLVQREVLRAAVLGRAGAAAAAAAAAARSLGEGQVVEVPAVGVLVDGQRLLAGRQGDAGGDRGPGLVAAGVRDGDRAGQVGAGRVGDVQRVGDRRTARPPGS